MVFKETVSGQFVLWPVESFDSFILDLLCLCVVCVCVQSLAPIKLKGTTVSREASSCSHYTGTAYSVCVCACVYVCARCKPLQMPSLEYVIAVL